MSIERAQVNDVFAFTDHAEIAAKVLDASLFVGEEALTVKELIEREAEILVADESILQRLLNALADSDQHEAQSNTHKDAFLAGALVALLVSDILAEQKLGTLLTYRERWLSQTTPFFATLPSGKPVDVYVAAAQADLHDINTSYSEAIQTVGVMLMPDEENNELFQAGFVHSLVNAQACIAEVVIESAIKEAVIEYEDIDTFLIENDLTGSLQEVHRAYLDHADALGLDLMRMSEAEAAKLLEYALSDYERFVPSMSTIEIEGPSFMTLIQQAQINDPEVDVEAYRLDEGCRLVGTVGSFTITVAPTDMSYCRVDESEDCATTYMLSYVFNDAVLTKSNGDVVDMTSGEQRVHVGIAVPGTKYRALSK